MELDNFTFLYFQDLIVIMSDLIEYHCPLYKGIYEDFRLQEHIYKVGL